jgi:hypothetical protein
VLRWQLSLYKITHLPEIVSDTGRQFNAQLPWSTNEVILYERSASPSSPRYNYGGWDLKRKYLPFIINTTTDTLTGWLEVSMKDGWYDYLLAIDGYGYCSANIKLGIERTNVSNFNIYPNPFTNSINIESKSRFKGTAKITSIEGELINAYEISSQAISIDLTHLKAGIYLLNIDHSNYSYSRKIIKR